VPDRSPEKARAFLCGLYAILDLEVLGERDPGLSAQALCTGGARVVQLRAKKASTRQILGLAREIRRRTREQGAIFLVNDRVDIALLAEADGVHLGQEDLPVEEARRLLPPGSLIGLSTHSEAEVRAALATGADYLGFGPVFATSTKDRPAPVQGLAGLAAASRLSPLPVVAIGGITVDRAASVRAAGASAMAVISGLLSASDLAQRARAFCEAWERSASSC
jgi:thiamine-phosphate pyrophosphorylase